MTHAMLLGTVRNRHVLYDVRAFRRGDIITDVVENTTITSRAI